MGLDMFEVVLEIEGAFDIRFDKDDYERCATVGGIRDLVVEKLHAAGRIATRLNPCLSTAVFCKVRESLATVTAVDRRQVRPSACVEHLLPTPTRRKVWRQWEQALGVDPPPLRRSWSVVFAATILVISFYVTLSHFAGVAAKSLQFAAAGAAIVTAIAAIVLTRPLAVVVPAGATTFRDLTSNLMAHHATTFRQQLSPQEPQWTPQEANLVVKGILVEQLGVEPERVTPEARIVEDLGAN
jgi:acyl carrier protein